MELLNYNYPFFQNGNDLLITNLNLKIIIENGISKILYGYHVLSNIFYTFILYFQTIMNQLVNREKNMLSKIYKLVLDNNVLTIEQILLAFIVINIFMFILEIRNQPIEHRNSIIELKDSINELENLLRETNKTNNELEFQVSNYEKKINILAHEMNELHNQIVLNMKEINKMKRVVKKYTFE